MGKQPKRQPGLILNPAECDTSIIIPAWMKQDEADSRDDDTPIVGQSRYKPKPTRNQRKRDRKNRERPPRKSGRTKARERRAMTDCVMSGNKEPVPTAHRLSMIESTHQVAQTELAALQGKLQETKLHGERTLLEMDIESKQEQVNRLAEQMTRMRERIAKMESTS